ncbi:MAG: BACON domain-containing carbohydrate-binding protein [Pseudolysinimonas sp.]
MTCRVVGTVAALTFAISTAHAAAPQQSFLYVASPQSPCAPNAPCPPSELYVVDSQTLGIVTRIPLIANSAQHKLAVAPDGRLLYVISDRGTTVVDLSTHTVSHTLPDRVGIPYHRPAISRDGARAFVVDAFPLQSVKALDTASGTVSYFSPLYTTFVGAIAANPATDRLYAFAQGPQIEGGVGEFDSRTGTLLRTIHPGGPLAVSPDGTRLYVGPSVLDATSLTPLATFQEESPYDIIAGLRGRHVYSLAFVGGSPSPDSLRLRVFDAVTLNPAAQAETLIAGAVNLMPSEDESRVFVSTRALISSFFDVTGSTTIYRNAISVVDTVTGQSVGDVKLPDSSYLAIGGFHPTGPPDAGAALETTRPGLPRCAYDVGPTRNAWTVAGGASTIAVSTPCAWMASSNAPWVRVSQTAGTTGATFTVTVDPAVTAAPRAATLTVAGRLVTISQAGYGSTAPFGSFDTPIEGTTGFSGSLAVTGWALDDVGVAGVRIFRDPFSSEPNTGPIFVGNAPMVEGARPDVVAAFSTAPFNTRAGWGYMLLTNVLPNHGNGTFRLYAYVDDVEGHTTILGPRAFSSSNIDATVPFGAIDTPGQGEAVSGIVVCFGWTLAPQPNLIPLDGSTIDVSIDGLVVGHPVYNNFRSDVAALFPNYQNTMGAVGYFMVDTTQYTNGVHTLAWVVRDQAGNGAGIGSRYFTIQNP